MKENEIEIVTCKNGHMYPAHLHKTCPYCIKFEENSAKLMAERNARKQANNRELHINTRWENFKQWLDEGTSGLSFLFSMIGDKLQDLPDRDRWKDPHFWDLYR